MIPFVQQFMNKFKTLIVSRRKNERIVINLRDTGEVIGVISVVQCNEDRAKISLSFPQSFEINREEIYESKMLDKTINLPQ